MDDQATATLMKVFYRKLWKENKPPIVALRETQLAIYQHPEQIEVPTTGRGPDFGKPSPLPDKEL